MRHVVERRGVSRAMVLAVALSLLVHAVVLLAILWRPVRKLPVPVLPNQNVVQIVVTKGSGGGRTDTARGQPAAPLPPTPPTPPTAPPAATPTTPPPTKLPPGDVAKPLAVPTTEKPPPSPAPVAPLTQATASLPPPPPLTAPPPPPLAKVAPQPATTPQPKQKPTPAPTPPSLPMEFGDLGGTTVVLPKNDKSLQAATPDKGNLPPAYPQEAVRRREEGTVALELHIGPDGFVDRVDVVHSSGYPLLDQAAISRLRTWHFTPPMQGGLPVGSIYRIAITFGP